MTVTYRLQIIVTESDRPSDQEESDRPTYPPSMDTPMITQTKIKLEGLTTRDREIIAAVINRSDFPQLLFATDIVTIWIECGCTVWVRLVSGSVALDRDAFKAAVAEIKVATPGVAA